MAFSPNGRAACPDGERCSAQAPRGLTFTSRSSPELGRAVAITGVGGLQTIDFAPRPNVPVSISVVSGPGSILSLDGGGPGFSYAPDDAGVTRVSIRETATGALLDHVTLEAADPNQLAYFSSEPTWFIPAANVATLWIGTTIQVNAWTALVRDAGTKMVVDERWSMTSSNPAVLEANERTLRGVSVGNAVARVHFGQAALSTQVDVIANVDAIEVLDATQSPPRPAASPWIARQGIVIAHAIHRGSVAINAPIAVEGLPAESTVVQVGPGTVIQIALTPATLVRLPVTLRVGAVSLRGEIHIPPANL